jgi:hypothetical protein
LKSITKACMAQVSSKVLVTRSGPSLNCGDWHAKTHLGQKATSGARVRPGGSWDAHDRWTGIRTLSTAYPKTRLIERQAEMPF